MHRNPHGVVQISGGTMKFGGVEVAFGQGSLTIGEQRKMRIEDQEEDTSFLVVTDTHFNDWQSNVMTPSFVERMYKELLETCVRAISDNKIDNFIFMGDLFQRWDMNLMKVVDLGYRFINDVVDLLYEGGETQLIAGNHDYIDKGKRTTLDCLSRRDPDIFVISATSQMDLSFPTMGQFDDIIFVPHPNQYKAHEFSYLDWDYFAAFCHVDLPGAHYTQDGTVTCKDAGYEELFRRKYGQVNGRKFAFNGHFHIPQRIEISDDHIPVQCLGAPYAFNWNDAESSRLGVHVVKLPSGRTLHYGVPTPRFFNSPSNPAYRQGFDLVRDLEQLKTQRAAKDSTRRGHGIISGADIHLSIDEYTRIHEPDELLATEASAAGKVIYSGGDL